MTAAELTTDSERAIPPFAAAMNVIALVAGAGCIAMAWLDISSPVRIALAIILFTFGPGSGLVQFLRIRDGALQAGLVLVMSGALGLLVAQFLLAAHSITALGGAIMLTGITCIRPIPGRRVKPPEKAPA